MQRLLAPLFLLLALAPWAVSADVSAPPSQLSSLVEAVDIPYERFELENGLVTIVHTDRKAPIVGVTIYYRVGSKHEPRGRTGFAHLYEHLFFGGSANAPSFDEPLESAGSTTTNGSTWYDRTNYVETVPTGALELALFLESDRMGYLLPAVTQDKLDKQREVVKNEKRQGDNQPYGLADYAVGEGLFPVDHPYRHATIGSMADLEAATLADVRKWFADHYGPNNVVLVLTGDIDAVSARPLVEKWFGAIPKGPDVRKAEAGPVTLDKLAVREMTDQVPVTRLTRNWSGPGLNDPDSIALDIGMHVLGGLASSRLDNELVRGDELAVSVRASALAFEQVSFLEASMDIKPGVERETAERRLDEVIADFIASGPTEDELMRAVSSTLSAEIGALELVGGFSGKGATLAEGELYSGDPGHFREALARMAALTPAEVKGTLQRWLGRPALAVNVMPGERTEIGEDMGGWGDEATRPASPPDPHHPAPDLPPAVARSAPEVAPVADLDFPDVERAKLSNGIPVALVRRTAIPKLEAVLSFDAGISADALDSPGTQSLMMNMLGEGTASRDATAIAMEQERLGASISASVNRDASLVSLSALTSNLAPSLKLMADMVRNPAFRADDFERARSGAQASLAQTLATPRSLASREASKLIFGSHPYSQPGDGYGDEKSLAALTADDMRAAHARWLRPDKARITAVGDVTMDELLPLLEGAFGSWQAPDEAPPAKGIDAATPAPEPRIVVIHRPNSPQSVIVAAKVLPVTGAIPDTEPLELANEVLGGGFLSRLNTYLREEKGWSYGVYSRLAHYLGPRPLAIAAPVQADRTGDALRAIRDLLAAFPGGDPATPEELDRVIEGGIKSFAQQLETNHNVLFAVLDNDVLGRPGDYYETLADRYRAAGGAAIDDAARIFLRPDGMTFVIVGDAEIIEPQLASIGIPVEIREFEP